MQATNQLVGLEKFRMEDATVGLWASGMQVKRVDWCRGHKSVGWDRISNHGSSSQEEPMDYGMHHDLCAGHLLLAHRFLPEDVQIAARFLADCSGIQFTHFHQRTGGRRRRRRKHQHDHVK